MDTAVDISASIRSGDRSAVATVETCLARIEAENGALGAFREVHAERALARARAVDEAVAAGDDPGPLAGVPVGLKDNIVTDYGTTACGSRMLEGYRSPYTATAVTRLEAAGAIVVGKTNCDEFAMGSSSEHCHFGAVRNPFDPARVPGGSSGGSAAAVAAGMCPAALGSDTGGSIRQPAAFCGVVGLKPSYGRVSRYGLVAFGSSLDQIGPLSATVTDAAALASVIFGGDPRDASCDERPAPDLAATLEQPIAGLRLGVARQYARAANHPAVTAAVETAIDRLRAAGAVIVDVDLPLTDYGIATYYVLAPAEASSNLARFDGIRYGRRADLSDGETLYDLYARSRAEGFGAEVQRRIMLGTYVLSAGYHDAFYQRAQLARRLIRAEFDAAFDRCDAIVGPTAPGPAFLIGSQTDPLAMYLNDVYTVNTNIAGICGISVPAGFAIVDGARLPVGVQFQCRAFGEETLLRVARMYERARGDV